MNKILRIGLLGLMGIVLLGSSAAFGRGASGAGHGSGEDHVGGLNHRGEVAPGFAEGDKEGWKDEKTPPGWSKGKKKGWGDAKMPPGLVRKESELR